MPKVKIKDLETELSEKIFGTGANETKITLLSKETRIPKQTLYRYKANPYSMPLKALIKIAEVRGINTGDIKGEI